VHEVEASLSGEDASPQEAVAALVRRVAAMREAIDVLQDTAPVAGRTRREFG
jgi:hypothetical protein